VQVKLERLKMLVGLRQGWREQVAEVRRMRQWVLHTEQILAGQWATPEEPLTNANVARRFDTWCQHLAQSATASPLSVTEQDCLTHFLKVSADLRPHLIQCYDVKDFPRTNNDMERYIRSLKTRYRRIGGRKNWNAYLLRYGRCIAHYDWLAGEPREGASVALVLGRVGHERWRVVRAQWRQEQSDQVKMYRFRHKRQRFLQDLETRWATGSCCTGLLH
jgi:hypothetical protein